MRTRPSASSMMLAGLRSRCSTPSCAAARPAQIWRAISVAALPEAADALQQPGQIFAVDQLHRQEHAAVVLADVVDAADVAVRHLARDAHLVVELGEPLRILGNGRRQELQRDGLAEPQILGTVDLAHAATADQPEDAVALGEQRTRGHRIAGGPDPTTASRDAMPRRRTGATPARRCPTGAGLGERGLVGRRASRHSTCGCRGSVLEQAAEQRRAGPRMDEREQRQRGQAAADQPRRRGMPRRPGCS